MAFEFNLNDVALAANTTVDLTDLFGDAFGNSITTDDGAAITWYQLWDKSGAGYFEGPNGNSTENGGGYHGVQFSEDGWISADDTISRNGETFAAFDEQTYVSGASDSMDTIWIRAYDENGVSSDWQAIDITTNQEIVLTTEADRAEGSNVDDTFVSYGPEANMFGAVVNTLQTGDRLDGQGGTDTLEATLVSDYVAGGPSTAVRPITDDIENVFINALGEDQLSTGGDNLNNFNELRLNADAMDDLEQLWSDGSEQSLRVENVSNPGDTEELTIGMRDTGNAGSEGDRPAADYEVYFREAELEAGTTGEGGYFYDLLNQAEFDLDNANPVRDFPLESLRFDVSFAGAAVEQFRVSVTEAELAGIDTHDELVVLLNSKLDELIATDSRLDDLEFVVEGNFTDPDGRTSDRIVLQDNDPEGRAIVSGAVRLQEEATAGNLFWNQGPQDTITTQEPVTASVILDNVGRDSDGGYLRVGSMSDQSNGSVSDAVSTGIEDYRLVVRGEDPNDDGANASSLAGLYTTNNTLDRIFISSDGDDDADLFIGNDNTAPVVGDIVTEAGLSLIDASGFNGDLNLGTAANHIVNLETLSANIDGDVVFYGDVTAENEYAYTTGSGSDQVWLDYTTDAVDADESAIDVDTNAGADTVDVDVTAATVSQFVNHFELMNVNVDSGSGDDTVMIGNNWSAVEVDASAGNDYIQVSDSTDANTAEWIFNADSTLLSGVIGRGNNDYMMFNVQLQVEFQGITSEVVSIDSSNFMSSSRDINDAIREAIEDDAQLSQLLAVSDIKNDGLRVESTIHRALANDALNVSFIAPTYTPNDSDNQDAPFNGDSADLFAARNAVTEQQLEQAWATYYPDSQGIGDGSGDDIFAGVGNSAQAMYDAMFAAVDYTDENMANADGAADNDEFGNRYNKEQTEAGANSTENTINVIEAGSGNDMIVLSSLVNGGFDTIVYDGSFGHDTVMNFNTGTGGTVADQWDFTAYLDADAAERGASVSAADRVDQRAEYDFVNGLNAGANANLGAGSIDHNHVVMTGVSELFPEFTANAGDLPTSFDGISATMVERSLEELGQGWVDETNAADDNMVGSTFVLRVARDRQIETDENGDALLGDFIVNQEDAQKENVYSVVIGWDNANDEYTFSVTERGTIEYGDMFSTLADVTEDSIADTPDGSDSVDAVTEYFEDTANGGDMNLAPSAGNDTATTTEDATVTIDLLANDTDADGDALSIVSLDTATLQGAVTNNGDGTVTYNPNDAFDSLDDGESATDSFSYTVTDPQGATDTADVTVTVNGVTGANAAPVFTSGESFDVEENSTAVTTVAATDADGDAIEYSITGGADENLFAIDADSGELSFTTAPDFENPTDADDDGVYQVEVGASDGQVTVDQALQVTVTDVDETGGGTQAVSAANDGETFDASTGDVTYDLEGGTYAVSIDSFDTGDVLDAQDIAGTTTATFNVLSDRDQADGQQQVTFSDPDAGTTTTITLTGLSEAQDSGAFNASSFENVFGQDSVLL